MIGGTMTMNYDEMSATADKWLKPDGSVTTMAGDIILPASPARAETYKGMSPSAAKWLLPDGSIVSELPASGGGSGGSDSGAEKRPTLYNAVCSTASNVNQKELTGLPEGYEPRAGDFIMVEFQNMDFYSNTAIHCQFVISGIDYQIYFNGTGNTTDSSPWNYGGVFPFYFDGTFFHQLCYAKNTDDSEPKNGIFEQNLSHTEIRINSERDIGQFQIALERTDGTYDSACLPPVSDDNPKPVNADTDFKVDGCIWYSGDDYYYKGNSCYALTAKIQTNQIWNLVLHSFNGTSHLQPFNWVYLVGIPQDNPMVYRLDAASYTSWYATEVPTAEDGKVYIKLGYYGFGRNFSLFANHPAYWFRDGAFRPYLT